MSQITSNFENKTWLNPNDTTYFSTKYLIEPNVLQDKAGKFAKLALIIEQRRLIIQGYISFEDDVGNNIAEMYTPDSSFVYLNEDNCIRKGLIGSDDFSKLMNLNGFEYQYLIERLFFLMFPNKPHNECMDFEGLCQFMNILSKNGNYVEKINIAFNIFDEDEDTLLNFKELCQFLKVANLTNGNFLSAPQLEELATDIMITHGFKSDACLELQDLALNRVIDIKNFFQLVTYKEVLLSFFQLDLSQNILFPNNTMPHFKLHPSFESITTRKKPVQFLRTTPKQSRELKYSNNHKEKLIELANKRKLLSSVDLKLGSSAAMPAHEIRKKKGSLELQQLSKMKVLNSQIEDEEPLPIRELQHSSFYNESYSFESLLSKLSLNVLGKPESNDKKLKKSKSMIPCTKLPKILPKDSQKSKSIATKNLSKLYHVQPLPLPTKQFNIPPFNLNKIAAPRYLSNIEVFEEVKNYGDEQFQYTLKENFTSVNLSNLKQMDIIIPTPASNIKKLELPCIKFKQSDKNLSKFETRLFNPSHGIFENPVLELKWRQLYHQEMKKSILF